MTKKLLVVAASGLVLAILLLSAAWVAGGQAMLTAIHHGGWNFDFDSDDHDRGPKVTRAFIFNPDAPLTVDVPASLHFVRGDHVSMTATGAGPVVARLHWTDNRLSLDDGSLFSHHMMQVYIVAPHLPPLTVHGTGNVDVEHLDQPDLQLTLSGAGNIGVSGKVHTVTANSSGAGNIDLGELQATDATVAVAGVGNIDLNASGKVVASVAGAGNVSLHRKPAQLTSTITGVGSID